MYGITVIGTMIRFWVVHVDDTYPTPWVPEGLTLAEKSEYIEANGTDGHTILEAINYMIKHEEMPEEKLMALRNAASGRHNASATASATAGPSTYGGYATGYSRSLGLPIRNAPPTYADQPVSGEGESAVYSSPTPSSDTTNRDETDTEGNSPLWVQISPRIEERRKKESILHWDHEGIEYAKRANEFTRGEVQNGEEAYECYYYVGKKSGIYFWVYDFRSCEPW
jgi:hypothetical protein